MVPDPHRRPTLLSRAVQGVLFALFRWKGWTLTGSAPPERKFVLLGAPHTSNWDFVFFLGATQELGIRPSFMGKTTLFRWPATRFMLDMGGVPVDRSKRNNYTAQVAEHFAAADELALVIAPEGTRTSDGKWKSGFWHIARAAGVPIVPAWVDNSKMIGGVGEPLWPTDDYAADLARLAAYYRSVRPGCARFEVLAAQAEALAREGAAG